IQQSKGLFDVHSCEGQGTVIRLTFPAETTSALSSDKRPEPEGATSGKGECILVVEDNKEVRELACMILEGQGYHVQEAETAAHGLALFMAKPEAFDMVFTDIIMPGQMNGVALAKEVRKARPDVSVLITTGFAQDLHGHTNSSEFETLYKPYLPDELSDKVRDILNRQLDHRG
ncbi:MAG: response regulator, partial [Asticcacaulis sp.]